MDWLKELIKKNPFSALLLPSGLGGFNFFGNLLVAFSDGNIDGAELHNLMSSASGLETIILIIVMLALKQKRNNFV